MESESHTVRAAAFAAGTSAMLMVVPSVHAANNEVCLPLETVNGQVLSSRATAKEHSYRRKEEGVIAISVRGGPDMRDNPEKLTNVFRRDGLASECLFDPNMFQGGSKLSLYVAGVAVEYEGETTFSIGDMRENPEILRTAKRDSLLARASDTNLEASEKNR